MSLDMTEMFARLDALSTQDKLTLLKVRDAGGCIACTELDRETVEPSEMLAERLHHLENGEYVYVTSGTVTLRQWTAELLDGLEAARDAYNSGRE